MKRPRVQFTLRRLMILVAICAVLLAAVPWPLLIPLFLIVGLPIGGYVIDRARGGVGLAGSMAAGAIGVPLCGLGFFVLRGIQYKVRVFDSPLPWLATMALVVVGSGWGALMGSLAWSIQRLADRVDDPVPEPEPAVGPIHWIGFDDRQEPRARAGGKSR
ncbi:MAG: hypothetical protein ACYC61_25820 [Isosphaeraceae bacterium]